MALAKFYKFTLSVLLACALGGFSVIANANPSSPNIDQIKQTLAQKKNELEQLQRQLRRSETNLATASRRLDQTNKELKQQKIKLKQLNAQQQQNSDTLTKEQKKLASHLQGAYILGRQSYLKMVLNQQNPYKFSRILHYYRYINQQRISTIRSLRKTASSLLQSEHDIRQHQTELQQLKQQLIKEQRQYQQALGSRQTAVQQLNDVIKNKSSELANILANKQQLQEQIAKTHYGFTHPFIGAHFSRYRHHLPWPTPGKVLHLFDQQIRHSEIHWHGVLINAPAGQAVRAIASGKVVFAKWLAGYGFLMIINHGHGYMSLYGRNRVMYKKAGDTVKSGDLIARVGSSGGYNTPALYFAIRHYAKPLNPVDWCKKI